MTKIRAKLKKFVCMGQEVVGVSGDPRHHDPEFSYAVRRVREHQAIVVAADAKGASKAFAKLTRGVRPDFIDAVAVQAHCECCARPIFEAEEYALDSEGVAICDDCNQG